MKYLFFFFFFINPLLGSSQELFFTINPFGTNRYEFINYSDIENATWDFGDGTFSEENSPIHIFDSSKTYTVCLICDTVRYCRELTIQEENTNKLIKVYPIPVQSIVTIDISLLDIDFDFVEIYCPEGIRIYLSNNNDELFFIDLSEEESGLFTIIVWTKDNPRKNFVTTFQK